MDRSDPEPEPVTGSASQAPYVAVIFSSRRTDADADGYAAMADEMDAQARRQPGFVDVESARGADGFGITVSYWATEADAVAWKQVTDHLGAQRLGRERWYESYTTRVATVTRSYHWNRPSGDRRRSAAPYSRPDDRPGPAEPSPMTDRIDPTVPMTVPTVPTVPTDGLTLARTARCGRRRRIDDPFLLDVAR